MLENFDPRAPIINDTACEVHPQQLNVHTFGSGQVLHRSLDRITEVIDRLVSDFTGLGATTADISTPASLRDQLDKLREVIQRFRDFSISLNPTTLPIEPLKAPSYETVEEALQAIRSGQTLTATIPDPTMSNLAARLRELSDKEEQEEGQPLYYNNEIFSMVLDVLQSQEIQGSMRQLVDVLLSGLPKESLKLGKNCFVTYDPMENSPRSAPLPVHVDNHFFDYKDTGELSFADSGMQMEALNLLYIDSDKSEAGTPIFLCESITYHNVVMEHRFSRTFQAGEGNFINNFNKMLDAISSLVESKVLSEQESQELSANLASSARSFIDAQISILASLGYQQFVGPINTPLLMKGGAKGTFHMGGTNDRRLLSFLVSNYMALS